MSNPDTITTGDVHWLYEPPPNLTKKVFLLTTGRIAITGIWGTGNGVIAWAPIPKRNKKLEEELGL